MPPPRLLDTRDCFCLAARREARAITRVYEERLRPHGLRATQFSVLAALSLKGSTPISELAAFLVLERTTLTRGAAVLRRKGWIEDTPSPDARERRLRITVSGKRRLLAALPAWHEAQELIGTDPARHAAITLNSSARTRR